MDGYAPHAAEGEFDLNFAAEPPPLVRFDERRMHVRAYNYWASLLGDRTFPSIEDLNPEEIEDFGSHSVLLDFTSGIDNPAIAFLGSALRIECDLPETVARISDVPARTLLSRLTDHYMQILANEAPIGFEAEFTNQRGVDILYRGILMPFSTDDDTIDFIYGVINWKEVAASVMTDDIARAVEGIGARAAADGSPAIGIGQVWGVDAGDDHFDMPHEPLVDARGRVGVARPTDGPADADANWDDDVLDLDQFVDPFGKALNDARRAAADAIGLEGRSHQALYRAVGLAHAFAVLASACAEDYALLLAQADIAVQPRSPLTALARLVFGTDYDKTRLSEIATVIDHACRDGVEPGALEALLAGTPGGIKGYLRFARAARRGEAEVPAPAAKGTRMRRRLAKVEPVAIETIATDDQGFAVVLIRRNADGSMAALGGLPADDRRAQGIFRAVASDRA